MKGFLNLYFFIYSEQAIFASETSQQDFSPLLLLFDEIINPAFVSVLKLTVVLSAEEAS